MSGPTLPATGSGFRLLLAEEEGKHGANAASEATVAATSSMRASDHPTSPGARARPGPPVHDQREREGPEGESAIWRRLSRISKRCLRDVGPPPPRPPAAQEGGAEGPPGQGESRSNLLSSRRQNVGQSVINWLNAELGPATSGTAKRVGEGPRSPRLRPQGGSSAFLFG